MELYQRIADFYDSSSGLWERIWGEHMHHGYYGRGGKIKLDRRQ
ncbi:MAG: SAM-dependent methyltransferase, partial [Microcystis sp.]